MNRRKKQSGGQALILVTLGLLAMCGMMGLSVDLGWSFFVHKQAQTAADGAALAAVDEAYNRLIQGNAPVSSFSCNSSGSGATQIECSAQVRCHSITATSNLNNGCQYAIRNGFDDRASRQIVTLESNSYDGVTASLLPATTGTSIKNISYWVTARTTQTVPQLFSAVISRTEGTVSAVATAAIAGSVTPGSFFGMDRRGDCLTTVTSGGGGSGKHCGIDVVGGPGNGVANCGLAGKANLCAPAGIILSSNCSGAGESNNAECSKVDGGFAGTDPKLAAGSSLIVAGPSGAVTDPTKWVNMSGTPTAPTHFSSSDPVFNDVFAPNPQPPIMTDGTTMGRCGIPHASATDTFASISGPSKGAETIGNYLYYSYLASDPSHTPDGKPIVVSGNVTFASGSGCPSETPKGVGFGAGVQNTPTFPTTVFYGGVTVNKQATVNLGPGQYVLAGVKAGSGNPLLNFQTQATLQADPGQSAAQTMGTMMIFTDNQYPGLNLPAGFNADGAMDQGNVNIKNGSVTMYGVSQFDKTGGSTGLPDNLKAYSGVVMWQDRRNSDVGYDKASGDPGCNGLCGGDHGDVLFCQVDCKYPATTSGTYASDLADMVAKNHVTASSPALVLDAGNANIALYGTVYQPRGAWTELVAGGVGTSCGGGGFCPLQVVTGSLVEITGNTSVLLAGPTNPILTFKPTLIH